jgi:DNA-binding response OmpR family regulator
VDEGYEVTSFDNGRDALAYLNGSSADVLLLDWRMPNLTGSTGCGKCAAPALPFQSSF